MHVIHNQHSCFHGPSSFTLFYTFIRADVHDFVLILNVCKVFDSVSRPNSFMVAICIVMRKKNPRESCV